MKNYNRSTAEELQNWQGDAVDQRGIAHRQQRDQKQVAGLASGHSDLQNLTDTSDIGTQHLDPEMRIRMLTPTVMEMFNVTDAETGWPITDFSHKLDYTLIEGREP